MGAREITLDRLEDQINWYDKRSATNRRGYRCCKVMELAAAALVALSPGLVALQKATATSAATVWPYVTAGLGAFVIALVGLQHLYQFHTNYVSYRATCQALRHEKFLFLATAGPYAETPDPPRLLAERVEALLSSENMQWVSVALQPTQAQEPVGGKTSGK